MRIHGMAALGMLLAAPVLVQAHEGEQHAAPQVAAVPAPGSNLLTLDATTEQFELVLKYPPEAPLDEVPLTLFLSDAPTNAPVDKAQIELQIPDAELRLKPEPDAAAGIYRASLSLPDTGTYDLIVAVRAGERRDLISLNGLRAGGEVERREGRSGREWTWGLGGALALAALAAILWRRAKH